MCSWICLIDLWDFIYNLILVADLKSMLVRELADTGFVSVQNFVKLGLYLKNWYDKQQASWEVKISKFKNWISLRNLHRSGLDLLPLFQVLPSPAMVFTLIFCNSCPQNLRSFVNLLPKLDFTKFWRNTNCLCADTLSVEEVIAHVGLRVCQVMERGSWVHSAQSEISKTNLTSTEKGLDYISYES